MRDAGLSFAPPVQRAFERIDATAFKQPLPDAEKDTPAKQAGKHPLVCRYCRYLITQRENAVDINGAHTHVLTNPAGFIYAIGCFSDAPGCRKHGPPIAEFTWFPGFSWCYALCANCHAHLGWFYLGAAQDQFCGLVLKHLRELEK